MLRTGSDQLKAAAGERNDLTLTLIHIFFIRLEIPKQTLVEA
jgi:hypothetical protein